MSEYVSRCFRCLAPNPAWGSTLCAACRQIESIEKSSQAQREAEAENAQRLAEQSRANARMQEELQQELYAQNERNAKLARKQARENARLAAEGGVSYEDAYQYGYHYLETADDNIYCSLTLQGELILQRSVFWDPYQMEHLVQAFDRGFKKRVEELALENPGRDFIDNSVYSAGYHFMPRFYIPYSVEVAGKMREFRTSDYETNFNRQVDLETGEVKYFYDNPFTKDEELNLTYTIGVNNKYTELDENTPEQLEERLRTEVAPILAQQEAQRQAEEAQRQRQRRSDQDDATSGDNATIIAAAISLVVLVIVGSLWFANHGFIAFVVLLAGAGITLWIWSEFLEEQYQRGSSAKYRIKNNIF